MSQELLAKLFNFKKEVVYKEEIHLWMRVPNDQVIDDARTDALLAARTLRRQLRDSQSKEYLLYLDSVEDFEEDDLYSACVTLAMRDVMRDYVNTNPKPPLPSLGDYPTQEEQEEYAVAKAQRELDYAEGMRLYVESWREQYLGGLKRGGVERAKQIYKKLRTDRAAEDLFTEKFEESMISRSVFLDEACKKPAFDPEQYKQAPSDFRRFVRDQMNELSVGGDELKK